MTARQPGTLHSRARLPLDSRFFITSTQTRILGDAEDLLLVMAHTSASSRYFGIILSKLPAHLASDRDWVTHGSDDFHFRRHEQMLGRISNKAMCVRAHQPRCQRKCAIPSQFSHGRLSSTSNRGREDAENAANVSLM